jgi:hypothetical protein
MKDLLAIISFPIIGFAFFVTAPIIGCCICCWVLCGVLCNVVGYLLFRQKRFIKSTEGSSGRTRFN